MVTADALMTAILAVERRKGADRANIGFESLNAVRIKGCLDLEAIAAELNGEPVLKVVKG